MWTKGCLKRNFFSENHAKPEDVAAHKKKRKEQLTPEEFADEEDYLADNRIYPIYITYYITETQKAFSVNFMTWSYKGGAHDNWEYAAISLDKSSGKEINVKKIFPSSRSIEHVVSWLYKSDNAWYSYFESCETDEEAFAPNTVSGAYHNAINMRRIVITPSGLDIIFAPYEQGSFAMGSMCAHIPLSNFKKLGINPSYWENSPDKK